MEDSARHPLLQGIGMEQRDRDRERQVLVNPALGNWLHDVYCKLQFSVSIQVLSCLITYNTV